MTTLEAQPRTANKFAGVLRWLALLLVAAMIALTIVWHLSAAITLPRAGAALLLTLPLWAPLPGIMQRNRRTYAWATLCVIPYFVLSITETIANPASRAWSGTCLALALMLFVVLIAYLRVTRPVNGEK
ncbi:MAG TPA: DUF2069 domain-containing protein [Povalibacter sp.]